MSIVYLQVHLESFYQKIFELQQTLFYCWIVFLGRILQLKKRYLVDPLEIMSKNARYLKLMQFRHRCLGADRHDMASIVCQTASYKCRCSS